MRTKAKKQKPSFEQEYLAWYRNTKPCSFNPQPLVQAAKEQWADRPDLIQALAMCNRQWPEGTKGLYTHCYDKAEEDRNPKWRHAGSRWLQCAVHGELLIDLHTRINNPHHWAIAGIEFMDRVMGDTSRPAPHLRVVHSKYRKNNA